MRNGDYLMVIAPTGYTGKLYRGRYCYEHHAVYWQHTGILVKEGEILHHINGDRHDNRYENLRLMPVAEHNRHHRMAPTQELTCPICHKKFIRTRRYIRNKLKNGKGLLFCSHECSGHYYSRKHYLG